MTPEQNLQRRDIIRGFATVLVGFPVFYALFLFLPAGTWDWPRGWLFAGVFTCATLLAGVFISIVNPEVAAARSRRHQGTKRWDKVLLWCFFPIVAAIFPVAALDDGAFHWSNLPWWAVALGYALMLVGFALMTWAEAVNKFFETTVRIQSDRGHHVIDRGPYAIVRHPGYVSGLLMFIGVALALGSLWALIPVAISCLLIALRTHWEDQMLQAELAGYKEYAQRVRARWIPGVW